MDDLREKAAKIPYNPHAAALAKKYVAEIRKQCGWSTPAKERQCNAQENIGELPESYREIAKELPKNFQETDKDWEVGDDELQSLLDLPL